MARLILLFFLVGYAAGQFGGNLTYDYVRTGINLLLRNKYASKDGIFSSIVILEYIPADIKAELTDLTSDSNKEELQTLIDLHNQNFQSPPKNKAAAMKLFKTKAPATYARIQKLVKNQQAKYAGLSETSKNFANYVQNTWKGAFGNKKTSMDQKLLAGVKATFAIEKKYKALPEDNKQEFRTNWPELMSFYEGPEMQIGLSFFRYKTDKQILSLFSSLKSVLSSQMKF